MTRRDGGRPVPADRQTVFLLNADHAEAKGEIGDTIPEMPLKGRVTAIGSPRYSSANLGWMVQPGGAAVAFDSFDDYLRIRYKVPYVEGRPSKNNVKIAGWFYFEKFAKAVATEDIFSYGVMDSTPLTAFMFNKWANPAVPHLKMGHKMVLDEKGVAPHLSTGEWHYIKIELKSGAWRLYIEHRLVAEGELPPDFTSDLSREEARELIVGGFIGAVDELRVREF